MTTAMVDAAFRDTAAAPATRADKPFRQGDFVVYPAHGVGRVERVGPVTVAGHRLDVIQIVFDENRMVVRVPVSKAAAAGLRRIATPQALDIALQGLQGRPRTSRMVWAKRAQDYQNRINSGDLAVLVEVVRDLQCAGDGSGSSFSQRNLFELAVDRLAGEVAAACNTDKASAVDRLTRALHTASTARQEPAT